MYPLEQLYGPRAFRTFQQNHVNSLTTTRQSADEVERDEALFARSYAELVDIVSFLSVMNKRSSLYFRGQGEDHPLKPTIFRETWVSLSGARHETLKDPRVRQAIWLHLNEEICNIVREVCDPLPMPRPATLKMFREAVWAIAQHYELWPTPLIDVTPNLRVAASFALRGARVSGYVYVAALPASTNSVTFDADQHVVLARLQAVCPPVAKRPHYQDGFLVGRFPFDGPIGNSIDRDPANVSNLGRRLVAKIRLQDVGEGQDVPATKRVGFWSDDFPRMSAQSLSPPVTDDQLLEGFLRFAPRIDEAMTKICAH